MKKLITLLSVSGLLLFGCGDETTDTSPEVETVEETTSIIVAESAEETAEKLSVKYDYEMVGPVPNDTEFGIVDYWEFEERHVVYANPGGGLMHVGGAGLTSDEATEFINNEDFPITEELQSILDATSFDDFYEDGVSSEYYNDYEGITIAVSPQFLSQDDVVFAVVFGIEP